MPALTDYDVASLSARLVSDGIDASHAARLLSHFYRNDGSVDAAKLSVPKRLLARLDADLPARQSRVLHAHPAADGTVKLLLGFTGGGTAEAVLMPSHRPDRAAGCVSSQIGCAMGCDFCASTLGGVERDLTAGEIVEQFLHLRSTAARSGRRLASLVFMGMGEPMLNLENVVAAIRRIADHGLGGLGYRPITVSTVGVVPGIDALAASGLNVHLAVSLHAPDDATRAAIVPAGRRYKVGDIVASARRYHDAVRLPVTFEYCLLAGVNDADAQAVLLASLLRGFRAHVNVIPYNPIGLGRSGRAYQRPGDACVERFLTILRDNGAVAHARVTRGDDVAAACGQLRRRTVSLAVSATSRR